MKNELVSVIIPVYNIEDYIEECILSARNQTYSNIEIILINDGSTDNSLSICESQAVLDKRIKVFSKKNGGLSDARNYGISKARGKYVFFLDGDDMIQGNTVEILYGLLDGEDDSISMCGFERFYESGRCINDCRNEIQNYTPIEYIESVLLLKDNTYAWGVLIPRKFLNKKFFIKGRYFEDMASMGVVYSVCGRIIKTNCRLYKYRINPNSIVHADNESIIRDRMKSANDFVSFVRKEYKIDDSICNVYLCEACNSCYAMSKDDKYLSMGKKLSMSVSLKNIPLKYKIKFLSFRYAYLYKLLRFVKERFLGRD